MMKKFSNKEKISLSLAVWLAEDQYDHVADPMHISATALLKSPKQIVLAGRVPAPSPGTAIDDLMLEDISDRVSSAMGTALHNGIENAWRHNYQQSLRDLGYPERVIERIILNPKPEDLVENSIPVYLEKRVEKKLGPFRISGKFDIVIDGQLDDYKSTGVYSFMTGTNDNKYRLQGSIYRWLNPELITNSFMNIQYIFTDWSKLRASIEAEKGYPKSRVVTHLIELMSIEETERWIKSKLQAVWDIKDLPENKMPDCTPEDLWQKPAVYKYYKNPENTKRSTANFDDYYLANERLVADGSIGIIKEVAGQVKACEYCAAFEVCQQKEIYLANNMLVI